MDEAQSKPKGPDLALGVKLGDIADGTSLLGHVGDEAVLLARLVNVMVTGCSCDGRFSQGNDVV